VAVWQILKITHEVKQKKGKLTLAMLATLARGNGGTSFDVGTGKHKFAVKLDLDTLCGGKVQLSKLVRGFSFSFALGRLTCCENRIWKL
jgi:hypothetical protein